MNLTLIFTRILFAIISIFFISVYMVSTAGRSLGLDLSFGIILGVIFAAFLFLVDFVFRRNNLRTFNTALVGLFFGYLLGQVLVLIFDAIIKISLPSFSLHTTFIEIIKILLFLFGTYLGMILAMRGADELYVSIPFVKFTPTTQKKKDMLIDLSVLSDARILDLCSTGILDHHLVIPRFVIKELYSHVESGDETAKNKARRCLDVVKKLEGIPTLDLRFNDTDFPDVKDSAQKFIRLARLIDANILTADISRVQMASIEGIRIINMHSLSNALKPLMQAGEFISIKVQRHGKEQNQGVGYLEDGTMVVINGGGDFIGETIDAQVLSVKHTSSGRMIFCNAVDAERKPLSDISPDFGKDDDEH